MRRSPGVHYSKNKNSRLHQMRSGAKVGGKYIPSIEELEEMLVALDGFNCPHCGVPFNWTMKEGGSSTICIQHDRSGGIRFLCFSCNNKHARYENDDFYTVPLDCKRCPICRVVKKSINFYKRVSGNLYSYCKVCQISIGTEIRRKKKFGP